jgi:hypothetical protein
MTCSGILEAPLGPYGKDGKYAAGGDAAVEWPLSQYFNKRHKQVGHLLQGRFKAVLIQKESHLLEAVEQHGYRQRKKPCYRKKSYA